MVKDRMVVGRGQEIISVKRGKVAHVTVNLNQDSNERYC